MSPTPHLHTGSAVVCQFTIDGTHHKLTGFVRHGISGDPDKLAVDILVPPNLDDDRTGQKNLLQSPVTFGRVLQHGDENEHATLRYVGE